MTTTVERAALPAGGPDPMASASVATAPVATPRWELGIALAGVVVAAGLLGLTVLALPTQLMLSDYVHVPGGLEPFVGGLLALAVALRATARLVTGSDRWAPGLLTAAAAGAVVTAAFPTDPTRATVVTLAGELHRWGAVAVLGGIPLAAWLVTRGAGGRAAWLVRRLVLVGVVAGVGTVLLHPASPVASVVGQPGWEGVAQRALAAVDIVLVAVLALSARRFRHRSSAFDG